MAKNKSQISKGKSYHEIGEYWDTHDLGDVWEKTSPASFEVDIQTQRQYFPLEKGLTEEIIKAARDKGISPETLLNLWIKEKVAEKK